MASAAGLPEDLISKAKQSRGEKKARKIMSKLGLKPVSKNTKLPCFLQFFFSYDDLLSFLKLPIVSEDNPWQAELNYSTINSSATFFGIRHYFKCET
jgi:hypothetical protein